MITSDANPPPPPVSPHQLMDVAALHANAPRLLAQLAFDEEPSQDEYEGDPWHFLFYSSSKDRYDEFFDALDRHDDHDDDGKLILESAAPSLAKIQQKRALFGIRGGDQQPHDQHPRMPSAAYVPDSNGYNAGGHQQQGQHQTKPPPPPPTPPPPPPQFPPGASQSSSTMHEFHDAHQIHSSHVPPPPPPSAQCPVTIDDNPFTPLPAPPPPSELPLRFLRAGKGDPIEGQRRYEATLQWRHENGINSILQTAHPEFETIKKYYPHFYHLRSRGGAPVFYELPPRTDLAALRKAGIGLDMLLHHYAMVTEFQWQCIERDDLARSITVIDLEGMRMRDFVGECVEYVKKCSAFTGQHYPERAGCVLVINVPAWFKMIWNVVKPMVDEVTLQKIRILRGKEEIFQELLDKIPIENIPPEYGGHSMPLGQSPQEMLLRDLMRHNNQLAQGDLSCGGRHAGCPHCSFRYARSY